MIKIIIGSFLCFFVILCTAYTATACTCSGQLSACEALSRADAVFTGTVTKTIGPGSNGRGAYLSFVGVEKVYKGSIPKQVRFQWGNSSCDVGMQTGEKWLLYATKVNKAGTLWSINTCDRSRLVVPGIDDLKYLNSERRSKNENRLSGSFTYANGIPVGEAEIEIEGTNKRLTLKTDKFGLFEAYGLAPGEYWVGPSQLNNWWGYRVDRRTLLNVGVGACVETSFRLETNNYIKGTVETEDGQPVTGVCVRASKANDKEVDPPEIEDCVNGEGKFYFSGVPAGQYKLWAENTALDRPWAPGRFPKVYFPNSLYGATSTPIMVNDEASAEVRIVIPKNHPLRLLKGTVVYSDGSLASDEMVLFKFRDGPETRTLDAKTDDKGRFVLPLTVGLRGRLTAEGRIWEYEIENCPKLVKYTSSDKDFTFLTETSKSIPLIIKSNRADLLLRLPYSKCEESK